MKLTDWDLLPSVRRANRLFAEGKGTEPLPCTVDIVPLRSVRKKVRQRKHEGAKERKVEKGH